MENKEWKITVEFTESEIKILATGLRQSLALAEKEGRSTDEVCDLIDKIYYEFKKKN